MKFKNKIYTLATLIITLFASCDKNEISPLQEIISGKARIAVINAIPGTPAVDIIADNMKINGSPLAYSVRFPLIQYSLLSPGNTTIKAVVNTPTTIPATAPNIPFGTELASSAFNFLTDKNYSAFITGIPGGATSSFIIEDVFPAVVTAKAHIKFVNAMPDGTSVDLFSGVLEGGATIASTSTSLFSNIVRNTGTEYIAVDATSAGTIYQFQLKLNSGDANVGAFLNQTVFPGRLYTVYSRGFNTAYTIPGFSPVRIVAAAPAISAFTNR